MYMWDVHLYLVALIRRARKARNKCTLKQTVNNTKAFVFIDWQIYAWTRRSGLNFYCAPSNCGHDLHHTEMIYRPWSVQYGIYFSTFSTANVLTFTIKARIFS